MITINHLSVVASLIVTTILVFPQNTNAQSNCSSRQIGERCQIVFSADAGTCSKDTGCQRDTGFIDNAVPSGYAVIGWTKYDDSWNGGTFNVQNASRGQNSSWDQAYRSLSETFQETKFKIDYLSRESAQIGDLAAKSEVERKLNMLSSDLNRNLTMWNSVSNVNTNIDLFKLQAKSWYTCTRKTWVGCIDGKGNHGKGHVVVNLVFIGDAQPLMTTSAMFKQQLNSLESEISTLKKYAPNSSSTNNNPPVGNTESVAKPNQSGCFPNEDSVACAARILIQTLMK